MLENELEYLRNQVSIARNEISKLRQQVRNLQCKQRKDFDGISNILQEYRCEGCRQAEAENKQNSNSKNVMPNAMNQVAGSECSVNFRYIGTIRTDFPEKRAVPRQASVGSRLRGVVELNFDIFSNPAHSIEGLDEYSHFWIIYHFHRNNAHAKAKIAPPRLGGERVGVFSTRSPHRPCAIGMSLVELDKVEGSTITFFGTDMVDGTPVLDIKPYIPFYDAPISLDSGRISVSLNESVDFYDSRQEPDGEESELELLGAAASGSSSSSNGSNIQVIPYQTNTSNHISSTPSAVKVPNWVAAGHRLEVCFNERAESQLLELQVKRQCIVDILEADPRSVYLRNKHGSQIFTFQLSEVTVTCKFDDKASKVTVVQIRRTENVQDNVAEH